MKEIHNISFGPVFKQSLVSLLPILLKVFFYGAIAFVVIGIEWSIFNHHWLLRPNEDPYPDYFFLGFVFCVLGMGVVIVLASRFDDGAEIFTY